MSSRLRRWRSRWLWSGGEPPRGQRESSIRPIEAGGQTWGMRLCTSRSAGLMTSPDRVLPAAIRLGCAADARGLHADRHSRRQRDQRRIGRARRRAVVDLLCRVATCGRCWTGPSRWARTAMPVTDWWHGDDRDVHRPGRPARGAGEAADPGWPRTSPAIGGSGKPVDWFEVLALTPSAPSVSTQTCSAGPSTPLDSLATDDRRGRGIRAAWAPNRQRWATICPRGRRGRSGQRRVARRVRVGPMAVDDQARRAPSATRRETCSASTTAPLADAGTRPGQTVRMAVPDRCASHTRARCR
jgi:hypothetical protein